MSRLKAKEHFTRLPVRVTTALERGDLTFKEYGLLVALIVLIDGEKSNVFVGRLTDLRGRTCWLDSDQWLRNTLHSLRSKGWISAEVAKGGRRWTIALTGAALIVDHDSTSNSTPVAEFDVKDSGFEVPATAAQVLERDSDASERRRVGGGPSKTLYEGKETSSIRRSAGARVPPRPRLSREEVQQERLDAANRLLAAQDAEAVCLAEAREFRDMLLLLDAKNFVDLVLGHRAHRAEGRRSSGSGSRGTSRGAVNASEVGNV